MLVLASASPRRQELLRNAGIPFNVHPASIVEIPNHGEAPLAFAMRMAREKARAVQPKFPESFVLGADTVVVIDGQILGKPRDDFDAARMLRLLSGRQHEVVTGVCLCGPGRNQPPATFEDVRAEKTVVTMTQFDQDEIQAYIATGEPMDKAGAYAIQGRASRWIPQIEGDYSNVVGLPVALVYQMLREHGALQP